jgi:hypothetical protein
MLWLCDYWFKDTCSAQYYKFHALIDRARMLLLGISPMTKHLDLDSDISHIERFIKPKALELCKRM